MSSQENKASELLGAKAKIEYLGRYLSDPDGFEADWNFLFFFIKLLNICVKSI